MMNFEEFSHEELIRYTKDLAQQKRKLDIQILDALSEIFSRKIYAIYGYASLGEFCREVFGLSEDCAWKRSQAARVISHFPKIREMLVTGETHISHVALVAAHITEANAEAILEKLPRCSKRDLQFFLSQLLPDGTLLEREPTIEVTMNLKRDVFEKLQRARQLASINCAGAVNYEDVLEEALNLFLSKKDPVEKAKRMPKRSQEKSSPKDETKTAHLSKEEALSPAPAQGVTVPAAIRREVILRSGGQCMFVGFDGRRCTSNFLSKNHSRIKRLNHLDR